MDTINARPRLILFGLRGTFTYETLRALLAADVLPAALILPAALPTAAPVSRLRPEPSPSTLPLVTPFVTPDAVSLAWEHELPVYEVDDLTAAEVAALLHELRPDVACVACFDRRIPAALFNLPPYGFLNVHPSLLPAYRGPAPLFWLFRDNAVAAMGVTIHRLDEGLDTGPILAQQPLRFPAGAGGAEIEQQCARAAAQLLLEYLPAVLSGERQGTPQPEDGSYHGWPTPDDFALDPAWSAEHAFNFMRATEHWLTPYRVQVEQSIFMLRAALRYEEQKPPWPYKRGDNELMIRFRPGTLYARPL